MAFKRIRDSVSRVRESVNAVEKRVDDYFVRLQELRREKSLYNLEIPVPSVKPSSSHPQADPDLVRLNGPEPLFHRIDSNGKRVPVFYADVGTQHSGKMFSYIAAVNEPESLSVAELSALLAHKLVQEHAPEFRKELLRKLLERKMKEESANSKK